MTHDDGLDGLGGHLPPRNTTNWHALALLLLTGLLASCGLVAWLVSR